MNELSVILLVFSGLLTLNAVMSAVLYLHHRTALHRASFLLWVCSMVSLLAQGLVQSKPAMIFAGGITTFGITLCLVDLVRRALDVRAHWRAYVVGFSAAVGVSAVLAAYSAPFWATALVISLGLALPLFDVCRGAVRGGWSRLTMAARFTVVAVVVCAMHMLDYPFLRDDPRWATPGFAVSILTVFALSITVPAIILERTADDLRRLETKAAEDERLSLIGEAAAVVAHEVRNPLGAMSNAIQLLRSEATLSEQGRELLSIQAAEIARLDRLVRDLLCFSGQLTPELREVDIARLVGTAVESVRARAEASHVRVEAGLSAPTHVRADVDHLLIALVNVLSNAIDASPAGSTVFTSVVNGGDEVRVTVDDEGSGVPPDVLNQIFKPFFTTRATGSGLGLAIVDRIMKAHGGSVRVQNLPERGSRFELVLCVLAA